MKKKITTVSEAIKAGYIVDLTVYPHVAYKGRKTNPTSSKLVYPDNEDEDFDLYAQEKREQLEADISKEDLKN